MGCHALLQGIFPTQGSNPGPLHCRRFLYHLSHQGSPTGHLEIPTSAWNIPFVHSLLPDQHLLNLTESDCMEFSRRLIPRGLVRCPLVPHCHFTLCVCAVFSTAVASAGDPRDTSSTPGLGRSPGVGNGNPLQYPCLDNSTDRGAWRAQSMGSQRVAHIEWLSTKGAESITVFNFWVINFLTVYFAGFWVPLAQALCPVILNPQYLGQGLAQSWCSVTMSWMNEWIRLKPEVCSWRFWEIRLER